MPSRRLILLLFSLGFFTLTFTFTSLRRQDARHSHSYTVPRKSGLRALFSFTSPSSLFPPSAIISLTDDNSTFFVARLAAFGPLLPSHGLSGQLWVGSGFGDDGLLTGGAVTRAEGELGCSDIPGWVEGEEKDATLSGNTAEQVQSSGSDKISDTANSEAPRHGRRDLSDDVTKSSELPMTKKADGQDGTDDHLHFPLRASQPVRSRRTLRSSSRGAAGRSHPGEHADIQSIQESAEIAGKVVMLSRGGCGFLEKVKWAQRRGGIALIVGDNTRGGPLLTMGANGDTSNVTIPSLFTSHTTAHLLSSLIPPGGLLEDLGQGDGPTSVEDGDATSTWTLAREDSVRDGPTFTTHARSGQPTAVTKPRLLKSHRKQLQRPFENRGWLAHVASRLGLDSKSDNGISLDDRRAPSSGRVKWVISEDWNDDQPLPKDGDSASAGKSEAQAKQSDPSITKAADKFVIGVHDWRDPDLVGQDDLADDAANGSSSMIAKVTEIASTSEDINPSLPTPGGAITPESGEYGQANADAEYDRLLEDSGRSWLSRLTSSSTTADSPWTEEEALTESLPKLSAKFSTIHQASEGRPVPPVSTHTGLWVTMTPTPASASPFFDTLLVLVVSPLVTLTVVYALLIIRSRIRRRRWRAPKSVVDRLPVRTYYTMPASRDSTTTHSSNASGRGSPVQQSQTPATNTTATSPLLLHAPAGSPTSSGTVTPRVPRPRSRTAAALSQGLAAAGLGLASAMLGRERGEEAKPAESGKKAGSGGKKKGYAGRQVECVICLEDYVHGESRVMKLPCGHEFHAECITPWLTTRRRTCPICKGDVVRSLAESSSTSTLSSLSPADHVASQSSTAIPIPRSITPPIGGATVLSAERDLIENDIVDPLHEVMNFDLERGSLHDDAWLDDARRFSHDERRPFGIVRAWNGLATGFSLSAFSGERGERDARAGMVDRDR